MMSPTASAVPEAKVPTLPAGIEIHSIVSQMPSLSLPEYQALRENIRVNEQNYPIVFYEGKILDGKHRYLACTELGVEPVIEEFTGTRSQAIRLALANNLLHRQLNKSQVAMTLVAVGEVPAPDPDGGRRERGTRGLIEELAEQHSVSHQYVYQAAHLWHEERDLAEQILSGQHTISKVLTYVDLREKDPEVADLYLAGRIKRGEAEHRANRMDLVPTKPTAPHVIHAPTLEDLTAPNTGIRADLLAVAATLIADDPDLTELVQSGFCTVAEAIDYLIEEAESQRLNAQRRPRPVQHRPAPKRQWAKEPTDRPWRGELRPHPLNVFPRMTDREYHALVLDIKEFGLNNPILLYQNMVLDGRERYCACIDAGVQPRFELFEGTDEGAKAKCIWNNLSRGILTQTQKVMIVADRMVPSVQVVDGRVRAGVPVQEVATRYGVNQVTLTKGLYIRAHGTRDEVEGLIDGRASLVPIERRIRETRRSSNSAVEVVT